MNFEDLRDIRNLRNFSEWVEQMKEDNFLHDEADLEDFVTESVGQLRGDEIGYDARELLVNLWSEYFGQMAKPKNILLRIPWKVKNFWRNEKLRSDIGQREMVWKTVSEYSEALAMDRSKKGAYLVTERYLKWSNSDTNTLIPGDVLYIRYESHQEGWYSLENKRTGSHVIIPHIEMNLLDRKGW